MRLAQVACPDTRPQPVDRVVRPLDDFLDIIEGHGADHRTKDFLPDNFHLVMGVGEDRGADKAALGKGPCLQPRTARDRVSAFLNAAVDIAHHLLKLLAGGQWTEFCRQVLR